MNTVIFLFLSNGNRYPCEQTESDESTLSAAKAIIFVGKRQAGKYLLRVHKVDTVLPEVRDTLRVVPGTYGV
ncbi:MAG TPA: hypothetical protein VH111_09520 [Steroidobacteraceae bacterium]|nr:hypothetical protein [Steroidobacteraceae bacterium]